MYFQVHYCQCKNVGKGCEIKKDERAVTICLSGWLLASLSRLNNRCSSLATLSNFPERTLAYIELERIVVLLIHT